MEQINLWQVFKTKEGRILWLRIGRGRYIEGIGVELIFDGLNINGRILLLNNDEFTIKNRKKEVKNEKTEEIDLQ